jgi:hypothetical protein
MIKRSKFDLWMFRILRSIMLFQCVLATGGVLWGVAHGTFPRAGHSWLGLIAALLVLWAVAIAFCLLVPKYTDRLFYALMRRLFGESYDQRN